MLIPLIDTFIFELNQAITKDEESFHKYYELTDELDLDESLVVENPKFKPRKLIEVNSELFPLDYLTKKYIFQNSGYGYFVGYNQLTYNKHLPFLRFGYMFESLFAYCYNYETEEVVVLFEETNEVFDYCAPNLTVFFELLRALLPYLSPYDGMLMHETNQVVLTERKAIATSIIEKLELGEKYRHFVMHLLVGEEEE